MQAPKHLYKYEAFSTQSLLNLKSQIVYFGSPRNFNDPYDSALKPAISRPSDEDVERIRNYYLGSEGLSPQQKENFLNTPVDLLRNSFMRGGSSALHQSTEDFLTKRGVTCFSESKDDLLMWSHYGGKYKGFCLEFSTAAWPFDKIHKVSYERVIPAVDLETAIKRPEEIVPTLLCTKSEAWKYEREWRAIHAEAGTKFAYPAECLTGIYFGPDIDEQSRAIICLILLGQNDSVKFWEGARSDAEFKVNFKEFTYTSHLETKRLGLVT